MDQQRIRLININQITTMIINPTTCSIRAYVTSGEDSFVALGTYGTVDKCKKVLAMISAAIVVDASTFTMPLGGDV